MPPNGPSEEWCTGVTDSLEEIKTILRGDGSNDKPGLVLKMDRHCRIEERRAVVMNIITTAALTACVGGVIWCIVWLAQHAR